MFYPLLLVLRKAERKWNPPSGIIRAALTKNYLLLLLLFLSLPLWGCATETKIPPLEATTTLIPYSIFSPTATNTPLIPIITPIPTIGPTATPFVHIVQKDDTLLGIAIRYGVTLEELMAANPGINPTILSIDQKVIIPGPEGDSASNFLPVATPIPLSFSEVTCYPTITGRLWCITSLSNHKGFPLEGVSVVISLLDEGGNIIMTGTAYSLINLIPDGSTIPFSILFSLSPSEFTAASVFPITAYPAENVAERYLPLEIIMEEDIAGEGQKNWHVSGKVLSSVEGEKTAERITILGIALDQKGKVVGFRKMEIESRISAGFELPFELDVFSLGPPIEHVEILAEALVIEEE